MRVPLYCSLYAVLVLACNSAHAEVCPGAEPIEVKTNDIFDLESPDTLWIHRLANQLNVVTKPATIQNELAFLDNQCTFEERDLREIERYLRSLKFIKTAQASVREDGALYVETSDKWSLMPTADFGRKGGTNTFSVGLKNRNVLGYGVDAEIEYFKDEQRSGYALESNFPLFLKHNLRASLILADNDDGNVQALSVGKDFISLNTQTAYSASLYRGTLTQQYFLNGEDYYALDYEDRRYQGQWGALWTASDDYVLRYLTGVEYTSRRFTGLEGNAQFQLPADRVYFSPFIGFDYEQDRFETLQNVHVINHIEDINFGWQVRAKLGVNVGARTHDEALLSLDARIRKATQLAPSALLISDFNFAANFAGTDTNRWKLTGNNELFYRLNPSFALYGGHRFTVGHNPYLDEVVAIGEDSGVRGYPLEFQRGTSATSFTAELRYYPNLSIANLFDVGAAVFADVGRAFGQQDFANESHQWLSSVGIGTRLYSRHAADIQVIHIDVSFPTLSHDNVNSVEFLVSTKTAF